MAPGPAHRTLDRANPLHDLCRLLGLEDPVAADPKGDRFTFEKGASKTGGPLSDDEILARLFVLNQARTAG